MTKIEVKNGKLIFPTGLSIDDLKISGLSPDEQETVIVISHDGKMTVSCYDNHMLTKVKKLYKAGRIKIIEIAQSSQEHAPGEITEIIFEADKKLLTWRMTDTKREMTDEQKAAAAERLRAVRNKASGNI